MGVAYQQVFKYETGQNRVATAQLYALAAVLGVEVGYFYEGYGEASRRPSPPSHNRLVLELVCSFLAIPDHHLQVTLCQLTRALAEQDTASMADDGTV